MQLSRNMLMTQGERYRCLTQEGKKPKEGRRGRQVKKRRTQVDRRQQVHNFPQRIGTAIQGSRQGQLANWATMTEPPRGLWHSPATSLNYIVPSNSGQLRVVRGWETKGNVWNNIFGRPATCSGAPVQWNNFNLTAKSQEESRHIREKLALYSRLSQDE